MHGKLIAVSPVGKNGQTVVPAAIRKLFKIAEGNNYVGFYIENNHVEIAPLEVEKRDVDYTEAELNKVEKLSTEKGGRKFKSPKAAKDFLKSL